MTMVIRRNTEDYPVLMTPAQVAALFRVTERCVRKWEKRGWLRRCGSFPLRFAEHEVRALLEGSTT